MQLFSSLADVPAEFGPSAVTIGKFDGVHRGHRVVISQLCEVAAGQGLTATVVTFDRHPLSLLSPEACPDALLSTKQKVELLAQTGVDATLILPFDRQFSEQSPEDFVLSTLVHGLRAKVLLVGEDFRFGAKGAGNVDLLRALGEQHGFEVQPITAVGTGEASGQGQRRVSSTWIRERLAAGRVREAGELLGALPSIRSIVVHGEHRGRELGYPTANLAPAIEGFVPADGIYAAWAVVDGIRYPVAVSVGNNPTFTGVPERQVEAHLFDEDMDLYGRQITVSFVDYVRPMMKFDSVDGLVAQMRHDDEAIRAIVAQSPVADAPLEGTPPRP